MVCNFIGDRGIFGVVGHWVEVSKRMVVCGVEMLLTIRCFRSIYQDN